MKRFLCDMKSGQNISWREAFVEDLSGTRGLERPSFSQEKRKRFPLLTKSGNSFIARILIPGTAASVEVVLHGIMTSADAHKALEAFHCGLER